MTPAINEATTGLHDAIEDYAERAMVMLRKNADYGSAIWHRPKLAPECDPGVAIRVRMSDKLERMMALLSKDAEVNDESFDDTMRDLGAYCLLELARPGR